MENWALESDFESTVHEKEAAVIAKGGTVECREFGLELANSIIAPLNYRNRGRIRRSVR